MFFVPYHAALVLNITPLVTFVNPTFPNFIDNFFFIIPLLIFLMNIFTDMYKNGVLLTVNSNNMSYLRSSHSNIICVILCVVTQRSGLMFVANWGKKRENYCKVLILFLSVRRILSVHIKILY